MVVQAEAISHPLLYMTNVLRTMAIKCAAALIKPLNGLGRWQKNNISFFNYYLPLLFFLFKCSFVY